MSTTNDGGQAFPTPETDRYHPVPGMSLRDYFAAKALAVAAEDFMHGYRDTDGNEPDFGDGGDRVPGTTINVDAAVIASYAYNIADAMIAERAKPERIPTPKKIRVPFTPEQKQHLQEMRQKRQAFAVERSVQILAAPEGKQRQLWIEAAKDAKKLGLYSKKTYTDDIASFLERVVNP